MKTRLLIITAFVVMLSGVVLFTIGMSVYFEVHKTEQRLANMAREGSSVPTISYQNVWIWFATSAIPLAASGILFVWRKRN